MLITGDVFCQGPVNIFNWGLPEDLKVLKRVGCSHSQRKNSPTPHSIDDTQKCKMVCIFFLSSRNIWARAYHSLSYLYIIIMCRMYGTIAKENDIRWANPHKAMCVIRNLLGNLILFIFTKIHYCRIVLVNLL